MKILKDIFARVFAIWAIIIFIITFLIFLIPSLMTSLVGEPKGMIWFNKLSRMWMNIWLPLVGCPVKIKGKENFKQGENYIVTFNHNALLDVPLSAPYTQGANKTIAKASFAKIPLFGWYYSRGSVLVDRKDPDSRKKSLDRMKEVLKNGLHMCIYPEGTRNRTNNPLKDFHEGGFRLAVDSKKAVIPAVIFGTRKAMPINKTFYFLPVKLELHFLPAVEPDNLTSAELKDKVFKLMWDYYNSKNEL
ncbi:MAG: 1-acyl-sn-glycerol-3-phosphate acyltransferase [Sphingobacteriales bacterium]|nr:1-acyl-sn-glycerol-3-phosphate acyltransferase [Sphingobacteriales bacterium]MBI3717820.1 1-acyl-sn-glycerol-3-phosphate acyltransferase [Sphingobacteriales bacterium]